MTHYNDTIWGDTLRVEVTQKDIDGGMKREPKWCPIALAIRALGFEEAVVGCELAEARRVHGYRTYRLSKRAQRFVRGFDDGRAVVPSSFVFKQDRPEGGA